MIDRVCEIPHEGPFCDLMWSDPEDIEAWAVSPRGAGWLFGSKVTTEFDRINGEGLMRGGGFQWLQGVTAACQGRVAWGCQGSCFAAVVHGRVCLQGR